jgi:zinc protease
MTLGLFSFTLYADSPDPFKDVTLHTLENGMKVILSPDKDSPLVKVKVNVGVGFVHEDEGNYGVSHLLEHVLFRSDKLKDDMSYLQLIKEKDGSANGTTSWDRTNYYATVKKEHSKWLIQNIHEMLMAPSLNPKHVETEKRTVLLEIGEPSPWVKAIGFDISKIFAPSYMKETPFWEKYFNVKLKSHYTRTEEQLRVLRLTPAQVKKHYREYYDPSNMQIIVSGGIHAQETLKLIQSLWGQHPTNKNGDLRPKYQATLSGKPFKNYSIGSNRKSVTLGYMVNNLSFKEKFVLSSYTDYLSHKLMKKLRNLNGETYTAYNRNEFRQDFGYFTIYFQTSKERFWDNYEIVKKLMHEDIFKSGLSNEDIVEAKRMYLNSFTLWGKQSEGSAKLAEVMFDSNEPYNSWITPGESLTLVTPEEYRGILKKFAQPNNEFVQISQPEVFFYMDYMLFGALASLALFFMFRRVLTKPFKNDHVLWVRKVRYPPLKFLEIFVGFLIVYCCMHLLFLSELVFDSEMIKATGVFAEYLAIISSVFLVILSAQFVISYFPRKLYYMDDHLVIKSLSYYSKRIYKDQIKSVTEISPWKLLFSFKMLRAWNRFFYYNPRCWKKGMLLELQSGKLYFFSTKDARLACEELNGLLNKRAYDSQDDLKEVA